MVKRNQGITALLVLAWLICAGVMAQQHYKTRSQAVLLHLNEEGKRQAKDIADSLKKSINYFRGIPPMLAGESTVQQALSFTGETNENAELKETTERELNDFLARVKNTLNPDAVWVMNPAGDCIAASNSNEAEGFIGANFSDRDYFRQTRQLRAGQQYAMGRHTNIPGLFYASPVLDHGQFIGSVAVKLNINDLTNWVEMANAFIVDGNGVVVLAKKQQLLMQALPNAPVNQLAPAKRQQLYHQDTFSTLSIEPWIRTNLAPLVLFNHETSPELLFSRSVPSEGLHVYVPENAAEYLALDREQWWFFTLMAMAGGSLILLGAASFQYINYYRRVNGTLIRQKYLLTEAERIARLGSWSCDLATGAMELSEQAAIIFQFELTQLPPTYAIFTEAASPKDRDRVKIALQLAVGNGVPYDIEYAIASPTGDERIVHVQGHLMHDEDGRAAKIMGTVQDVTQLKFVEKESKHTVSLLIATLESTADGILVVDRMGKVTRCNERFAQLWQLSNEQLRVQSDDQLLKFVLAQLRNPEGFIARVQHLYENPRLEGFDILEFKDGRIFERYSKPQIIEGQAVGRVWSFRDVTEQKRAEASVMESDRRLRILIDATVDIIFLKDGAGRWLLINQAAKTAFSLGEIDYPGKTALELADLIPQHKDTLQLCRLSDQKAWENRKPSHSEEYVQHDDGQRHCYDLIKVPIFNDDGTRHGIVVVGRDITERKHTEEELFKSRETLKMVLNNIPQRVFWKNREMIFEGCNLPMARDCGFTDPEQMIGKSDFELDTPANAESYRASDREVMEKDQPMLNLELTQTKADGSMVYLLVKKVPLHDQEGRVIGVLGAYEDITERKLLEGQFRQAQKMESIGRLAGGVAHDFNNLLTIICGYSEILLSEAPPKDPSRDALTEIKKAGERAAGLTRQLLAFSRKQVLEPDVLDLNSVVGDCENMFRRLLGEDIELKVILAPNLGKIRADSSQIDQVFLNLVVNARDAMPRGGKLTIETSNAVLDEVCSQLHPEVKPGKYVLLSVSDNGCGMDEQTLANIFEPFFTTKDQGKGTGLGLSMIFGFIKQSGGHISVSSELENGSRFKIYLPEFEEPMA